MVKRSLLAVATAILAASGATAAVPSPAYAEPDRHVPDPSAGYCPGGLGLAYHNPTGHGYCDGIHFPDGSYWHVVQLETPGRHTMQCVINPDGSLFPKPAPPGSCDGAV